uniref:LRAT domain-containing protein n=1 Tax=Noccaea caerulescens TaxID=107243 RepID=A0A1J3GA50_NOCCA
MGLFSNKISRDELKPGDHIYSWRNAYLYSHHGIYVGDGKVIHFTCGGGLEAGTGTFLDKIIVSSVPNHGGGSSPCLNCGDQSRLDGVISSCLDCFLAGGNLYLYEYGVSRALLMAKPRGGTCTTAASDPPEEALPRAEYLLLHKGFGVYDLLNNNCEDFAIYCKTGLIVLLKHGCSGQANSASAARRAFSWSCAGVLKSVSVGSVARYTLSSSLGVAGFACIALEGYGKYCRARLDADIGVRVDAFKVHVEDLASAIAITQGRSKNEIKDKLIIS